MKEKTLKILLRRSRRHEHNKSINSWQSAFTRPSLLWPSPRSVSRKFRKFVKNNRHSCLERFIALCDRKPSSIVYVRASYPEIIYLPELTSFFPLLFVPIQKPSCRLWTGRRVSSYFETLATFRSPADIRMFWLKKNENQSKQYNACLIRCCVTRKNSLGDATKRWLWTAATHDAHFNLTRRTRRYFFFIRDW